MKKHFLLVSMITALLLTSCGNTNSQGDNSGDNSSHDASQESSQNNSSESSSSSSSSWVDPYVPPEAQTVANDNFTINIPADLSSMSANCKKYVDDMKAQQRRLLAERGAEADYYLNDLYGDKGVDLTKGVVPSSGNYQDNTGGYRDGKTQNDYLDAVGADYTKGEKSDENKGITITFAPSSALDNKEYTVTYGKKEDLSDAVTFTTNEKSVNLKNLLVNQKYYFKVSADNKESKLASFTTGDYPRWIDARPMFNVRDMGGYMTSSGQRIKQGMIYRGGEINAKTGWYGTQRYTDDTGNSQARDGHIVSQTEDSKKAFREDMGMVNGLEIDLRSSGETNGYPSKSGYCNFAENNDISYKLIGISSYANGMKNNTSQIKQLFEETKSLFAGVAYAFKDTLVTHAGVTKEWYENKFGEYKGEKPSSVAKTINELWNHNKIEFTFNINASSWYDFSGDSPTHSPVWVRPWTLAEHNLFRRMGI